MTTRTMTKRQRRAQQLAELVKAQHALEAEEAAHDKAIEEAVRRAATARCAAVEELYELLGIEEVTTERRTKAGQVQQVRSDRDETRRARSLVDTVVAAVAERDRQRAQLAAGEERAGSEGITSGVASDNGPDESVDPHVRGWSSSA